MYGMQQQGLCDILLRVEAAELGSCFSTAVGVGVGVRCLV